MEMEEKEKEHQDSWFSISVRFFPFGIYFFKIKNKNT